MSVMEKIGMIKLSSLYNSKKKNYQDLDKQKSMEEEDFVDNSDVWKGESEKAVVSTQTDKQMCRVNTHARTHALTHTHTRTHARTHACTHTRARTHTHTHTHDDDDDDERRPPPTPPKKCKNTHNYAKTDRRLAKKMSSAEEGNPE